MGRILWLADYLFEDGLDPVVLPGWERRGKDGLDAEVLIGHHIGIAGGGNAPGLGAVTHGHGTLRGNSLSHVHQARFTGRPTVVASGVCWHAGLGGAFGVRGNRKALAIEAEGTTGEWMLDRQWEMYARIAASMLRGMGREEDRFITHQLWAEGRKVDAWAIMQTRGGIMVFRDQIAQARRGHPPILEEDDVPDPKHITTVVATPTGRGYYKVSAEGGVFAFGDAPFYGSIVGLPAEQRVFAPGEFVVGLALELDAAGNVVGYMLVTNHSDHTTADEYRFQRQVR